MDIGVGKILEGKVTGITRFGAFVALGDNQSGLVHISEIANTYVNDINDHLEKGQTVKVKVLSTDENGRINLSIKRAQEESAPARQGGGFRDRRSDNHHGNSGAPRRGSGGGSHGSASPRAAAPMTAEEAFEAKLKAFMTESEGKISALHHSERSRRR